MIKLLRDNPEFLEKAALWFNQKWNIPIEVYRGSIQECISNNSKIPQWYIILNDNQEIVAGAGVIDNDFHDRKDLTPNLCALFVEETYRNKGIAEYMLNYIRSDLKQLGFEKAYLLTDHTSFYERYGWEFLTMVNDSNGVPSRMYVASTF